MSLLLAQAASSVPASAPVSVVPDAATTLMLTPSELGTGIPSDIISMMNSLPTEIPTTTAAQIPPAVPATGWAKLIDPTWYFEPAPFTDGFPFLAGRPLAVLFVATLIVAFAMLIRAQLPRLKHRVAFRGTAYWLLFFGLTGSAFLYFRWDKVQFLSMRIWLVLILLGYAAWVIVRLVRFARQRRRV